MIDEILKNKDIDIPRIKETSSGILYTSGIEGI